MVRCSNFSLRSKVQYSSLDKTSRSGCNAASCARGTRSWSESGSTCKGSPGIRIQTFTEPTFEFKQVLVDAFATYNFVELPIQPTIPVVAGPPVLYKAILPTQRRVGQTFSLGFKGEDRWGNPSHLVRGRFRLEPSLPVRGLPQYLEFREGELSTMLPGLSVDQPGELRITVLDATDHALCIATPRACALPPSNRCIGADLHGQSEETIGTNSASELIESSPDRAFPDAMCHQGNDFQITTPFWEELNRLTARYKQGRPIHHFPGL